MLYGCSSSQYTVSSRGDEALIYLKDNSELKCELVSLQDSVLIISPASEKTFNYLTLPSGYYFLKLEDIDSVSVHGYNSGGWTTAVIMFQVLPAGLLTIAASSADAEVFGVFAIASIPAIVTTLFFLGSEQEAPGVKNKTGFGDLEKIRIYCRYPRKLEKHEMRKLLNLSSQKTLVQYKF
jgi:hypothetical protein